MIHVSLVNRSGVSMSVGTIAVGSNGTGLAAFPANFPNVATSMKVVLSRVNPLTGALTALTTATFSPVN